MTQPEIEGHHSAATISDVATSAAAAAAVASNIFNLSRFTINLSSRIFHPPEISLLDRGLKFIPTVCRFPLSHITECTIRNLRNLKLRDFFFGGPDRHYDPNSFANRFCPPSTWTPPFHTISPDTRKAILDIGKFTVDITADLISHSSDLGRGFVNVPFSRISRFNLTKPERWALRDLRRDRSIVIKPADKGGAVVVMDSRLYKTEALRQLTNTVYYRHISGPLYPTTVPLINNILDGMLQSGYISLKQYTYLRASPPARPRAFYLLPKVHKPRLKWPHPFMPEGRPIVSDCGSETYRICELVDFFLKPLATRHPSYIRDTYDFVSRVRNASVPSNSFIVTGDVTALYTNMDLRRSMDEVRAIFSANPDPRRPDEAILSLLDIALNYNDFKFDDQHFLQTTGIAMGKRFAPNLANIYLIKFDHAAMHDFHVKPSLYSRFIDDVFFIWSSSLALLRDYEKFLNSLIPGIRITLTVRREIAEFLDTLVYKRHLPIGQANTTVLGTRVYFKDTDTHQLLHGSSLHPRHTCRGVLKSQFIRFKRICTEPAEFEHACSILYRGLRHRGYSRSTFRRLKNHVWYSTDYDNHLAAIITNNNNSNHNLCTTTITTTTTTTNSQHQSTRIWPIINFYDPISTDIMTRTRHTISSLNIASHYRVLSAFKIHPNLSKLLVRSTFRSSS